MKRETTAKITNKIVNRLKEIDVSTWEQPWFGSASPQFSFQGEAYRGFNAFNLTLSKSIFGYSASHWLTFNKIKEFGAKLDKGSRGECVIYYNEALTKEGKAKVKNGIALDRNDKRKFLRYYTVFNASCIDGLDPEFYAPQSDVNNGSRPIQELHSIASNIIEGIKLEYKESAEPKAYYSPSNDFVHMPNIDLFNSPEGFYDTLFHELAHSTMHKSRLNRSFTGQDLGRSVAYACEELVAEIATAFISVSLGYNHGQIEDHAQYLKHWISILENDCNAIFKHAAQAQQAADYLLTHS